MRITSDKVQHIVCSALITILLGWIEPLWAAPAVALLAGLAKELRDWLSPKGVADLYDIIADVVGVAIGFIVVLCVHFCS